MKKITAALLIIMVTGSLFLSCQSDLGDTVIGASGTSLGSVDTDGDGTSDGTAIDSDGDGEADGIDTDGDGTIDEEWSSDYTITDSSDSSSDGSSSDTETEDTTAPAEITDLTLTEVSKNGYGVLSFSWTAPSDSDFSMVKVYYYTVYSSTDQYSREIEKGTNEVNISGQSFSSYSTLVFKTVDTSENESDGTSVKVYVPNSAALSSSLSVTYVNSSNVSDLDSLLTTEGYYLIEEDLDLDAISGYWEPVSSFSGVLAGNGHTISNLSIDSSTAESGSSTLTSNVGFIAKLTENSEIFGVILDDLNITIDSDTNLSNVGSLVGNSDDGIISYCGASGTIDAPGCTYVGGLIGYDWYTDDDPKKCYADVTVTGSSYVGGFGGRLFGAVDCYATGTVTGDSYVGGFEGQIAGAVTRCYSAGGVSGSSNYGGFIGSKSSSTLNVKNCFYNSGNNFAGESDNYATSITLTDSDEFTNFDFTSDSPVWSIDSSKTINSGMPYLTDLKPE